MSRLYMLFRVSEVPPAKAHNENKADKSIPGKIADTIDKGKIGDMFSGPFRVTAAVSLFERCDNACKYKADETIGKVKGQPLEAEYCCPLMGLGYFVEIVACEKGDQCEPYKDKGHRDETPIRVKSGNACKTKGTENKNDEHICFWTVVVSHELCNFWSDEAK